MKIELIERANTIIEYKKSLEFFRERLEKIIFEGDRPTLSITYELSYENNTQTSQQRIDGVSLRSPYDGCLLTKEHQQKLLAAVDEMIAEQDKLLAAL
jgi:hypothetical protein